MIEKVHYEDGLPISVIVPLSKKRENFFYEFVFPLIEANEPVEIIVNNDEGTAPKKRNDGFLESTQPYVFFCDDDIVLPKSLLYNMYNALENEKNPNIGYAYCGYYGIVMHPNTHPMRGNFQIPSRPFDSKLLKQGNYISTMSLIKREHFPMFDEKLKRLQDWDVFLTMLNNGISGKFISNNYFYAYYLDEGITSNTNSEKDAIIAIISKHNIGL